MPPIAQYVFNGIVTGGILALPAVAFSLLWRLLRFPNFAVSTYLTVGAYAALVLNAGAHVPLAVAWLGALVATGAVALAVDRIAFRPMRGRRPFSLAIASIGVAFVLENVVRFAWGNDFRAYDVPVTRAASVAGLRIGRDQLLILGAAVMLDDAGAGVPAPHPARHRDARNGRQPAARCCQRRPHRSRDRRRHVRRRRSGGRRRRLPRPGRQHRPPDGRRAHHLGLRRGDSRRHRLRAWRPRRGA